MSSVIAVHPEFDGYWPFAADYFRQLWQAQGPLTFIRLAHGDQRPLGDIIAFPAEVTRLVSLNLPVTERCLVAFSSLREAAFAPDLPPEMMESLTDRGVRVCIHT